MHAPGGVELIGGKIGVWFSRRIGVIIQVGLFVRLVEVVMETGDEEAVE
jgi:hypothetical protein